MEEKQNNPDASISQPSEPIEKVIQPVISHANETLHTDTAPSAGAQAVPNSPQSNGPPTAVINGAPVSFTQSPQSFVTPEYEAAEKKLRRKKIIKLVWIILGVLVLIAIALGVAGSTFLKFTSTTYDNGLGAKFKLSFYSDSKVAKVYGSHTTTPSTSDANLNAMYSNVSNGGEFPLIMYITREPVAALSATAYQDNSTCAHSTVADTVHNKVAGTDVHICSITQNGANLVELAVFKDKTYVYSTLFSQNPPNVANQSKQSAQAELKKIGLDVYQADIDKIVASIQPL